ncbi:hypothetical protein [Streptomyces sp. HB2AG]|uniref:hypothetical protein n=1 Tax=Streptomyces sp. HB2AG TaxID=2983400 RepID=UPI0022AB15CA|nr:hypothetical protein [Streptomyces sp. HB2AG]MCZ2526611.1 hypothetical protein [Streptomyces sp. HB2AG]
MVSVTAAAARARISSRRSRRHCSSTSVQVPTHSATAPSSRIGTARTAKCR